jgi:hypothetical protein
MKILIVFLILAGCTSKAADKACSEKKDVADACCQNPMKNQALCIDPDQAANMKRMSLAQTELVVGAETLHAGSDLYASLSRKCMIAVEDCVSACGAKPEQCRSNVDFAAQFQKKSDDFHTRAMDLAEKQKGLKITPPPKPVKQ